MHVAAWLQASVLCVAFATACHTTAQTLTAPSARSSAWAQPIERVGLPNLHQLSPQLYRGAQPTVEGLVELSRMGVKTVLSLRGFHDDPLPPDTTLDYERISFKTWHPETEDVVRFLRVVTDETKQPVFVHCQHGADRTGMMCAIYRIAVDGWSKSEAIREMTDGGYGFHPLWTNLVTFVEKLDVDAVRRDAGLR